MPSTEAWKVHTVAAVLYRGMDVLLHAVPLIEDPLEAEILGSDAAGVWWGSHGPYPWGGDDGEACVGGAFAVHLEELGELGDPAALPALRILQAGASDAISTHAEEAAARLVKQGLSDPAWWTIAQELRCTRAAELQAVEDELAPLVCLEFAREGRRWTLAVKLTLGDAPTVENIGIFPGLDDLQEVLDAAEVGGRALPPLRPLDVLVAHRRATDALAATRSPDDGGMVDPNVVALRGLAQRWLAVAGGRSPDGPLRRPRGRRRR